MKRLLRNRGVHAVLGWTLAGYMRLVAATVWWRHENLECVEPALAGSGGVVGLFWHSRIALCLAMVPQWRRKPTCALVSPSTDGEFFAIAIAKAGFPAIRGSTAKKGDAVRTLAAAAAYRAGVDWVAGGGALLLTPDGPRGPDEVMASGALQIARRTGAPVYLIGLAAHPAARARSWDRTMLARPFGRGAVVWDGPLYVPRDANEPDIAALALTWGERLSAATRRAEALVGPARIDPAAGG